MCSLEWSFEPLGTNFVKHSFWKLASLDEDIWGNDGYTAYANLMGFGLFLLSAPLVSLHTYIYICWCIHYGNIIHENCLGVHLPDQVVHPTHHGPSILHELSSVDRQANSFVLILTSRKGSNRQRRWWYSWEFGSLFTFWLLLLSPYWTAFFHKLTSNLCFM